MEPGSAKSIVIVCAADGSGRQSVWKIADLAALSFASQKDKAHITKLRANLREIEEVHKQLWPHVDIPAEQTFDIDAKQVNFRSGFLTTSMTVAAALHFAKHTKRAPDLRKRGVHILKSMVEQLCALDGGLEIHVMVLRPGGRFCWKQVVLHEACSDELWDPDNLPQSLQLAWITDRNDLACPRVESHIARPHLVEWLLFCLDVPARMRKMNARLARAKLAMQPGVLSIVSSIACKLDAKIAQLSSRISDFRNVARRSDKLARWSAVGAAADKLWDDSAP